MTAIHRGTPPLALRDVTRRYESGGSYVTALADVDFTVEALRG